MNAVILLSGGVGKRFGAALPKQYQMLCGKPVVQYAMDAALRAPSVDAAAVVMDPTYQDLLDTAGDPRVHFAPCGEERADSVRSGLDCIRSLGGACEKLVLLQAVNPFVTPEIIETYFALLDEYDVVTTAEKCPGQLFNRVRYEKLNRDQFLFCRAPEAFHFRDLDRYLDVHSPYSELIYHYPGEPKICFYTDFPDNVKLTRQSDLRFAEFLMREKQSGS